MVNFVWCPARNIKLKARDRAAAEASGAIKVKVVRIKDNRRTAVNQAEAGEEEARIQIRE